MNKFHCVWISSFWHELNRVLVRPDGKYGQDGKRIRTETGSTKSSCSLPVAHQDVRAYDQ